MLLNGHDMNLTQITAGLAWHYKKYQGEQRDEYRQLYANAEVEAQETRRGLWREVDPVAPWEWRKRKH